MEYTLSKIDAAVDQLDWAIRLFLDHQAYVPAITLAGAAEEILGETLGDKSAFAQLKTRLAALTGLSGKVISQEHLNRGKNWLKHWQGMRDDESIELDLEAEAIQYILRGVTNLVGHERSLPGAAPRFFAWVATHRKDLHEL
jgi:hypothetical protein